MYLAYSYTNNAERLQRWKISAFQLFTVFTYANSAINPVIYGFTNDFFKKSFRNIFGCQHPSGRRSGTVPNENGTVATRLRSTQCRPSRRRMTTLSGRPDLLEAFSRVQHSTSNCPVLIVAECDNDGCRTLTTTLASEATAGVRAMPSSPDDKELSTFTVTVATVHTNQDDATAL